MALTTEEQSKAEKIAAAADKFIIAKNGIREKLNTYGVPCGEDVPFVDYPDKVETLGRRSVPPVDIATVSVYLNPSGSDYWLPTTQAERELLLNGAYVRVTCRDYETPRQVSLTRLEGELITVSFPLVGSSVATIEFHFGTGQALVAKQTILVAAGVSASATCTTYENTVTGSKFAFGRAQVHFGTNTSTNKTFTILREYKQDGTTVDHVGYYDDTVPGVQTWISQTGIKLAIYAGGKTAADAVQEIPIENCDDANAIPIEHRFRCIRDIRIVTVNVGGTNETYVRFPACWTKRSYETISVQHKVNGEVTTTDSLTCVILWVADEACDESFHRHAAFVRSVRGGADVELDEIFVSRYKVSSSYTSVPGVAALGTNRKAYQDGIRGKNAKAVTYVDEYGVSHTYAANADTRRFAMIGYREQSLLTLYGYIYFGPDTQNGIGGHNGLRGICTSAAPDPGQPTTGSTDFLVAKGIMCGRSGYHSPDPSVDGGADYDDPRNATVFLGIENPFSSSEGTMMADVTSVAYRDGDEHTEPVNTLLFCLDRADYNVGVDTDGQQASWYDTLVNGGYHELATQYPETPPDDWSASASYTVGDLVTHKNRVYICIADNTGYPPTNASSHAIDTARWQPVRLYMDGCNRMADFTAPIERDLFFPTLAKGDRNITAFGCDTLWGNSIPASGSDARNWRMVALGAYRSYGASLGAFSLYANRSLGDSNGSHWRSRASLQLV